MNEQNEQNNKPLAQSIITAQQTYATVENAKRKLQNELGDRFETARWLIAVAQDGKRFVPTLLGSEFACYAHVGIMVIASV